MKDCNPGFNVFVVGDVITPQHHELVTRAITYGAPFSLTRRRPPHDRGWLEKFGCRGNRPDETDCDEYPYASAHQGGEFGLGTFYLINSRDNQTAGRELGGFYSRCKIDGDEYMGDQFFVLPIKGAPTTGLCGK